VLSVVARRSDERSVIAAVCILLYWR